MRFKPLEMLSACFARTPFVFGIPVITAVLVGCGNAPSPEERRADAVLANAKAELGRSDNRKAKEDLLGALALDEALNRKARVAEENLLLGDLAAASATDDSALDWYAMSLEQYRALADRNGVRETTLRVASMSRRMGDERKAFSMYVEMLPRACLPRR